MAKKKRPISQKGKALIDNFEAATKDRPAILGNDPDADRHHERTKRELAEYIRSLEVLVGYFKYSNKRRAK